MIVRALYIIVFAVSIVKGYSAPVTWSQGSVVLANHEVIVGEIRVEETNDLILLKNKSGVSVLPAYKVERVYVFDERHRINRKFVSRRDDSMVINVYHLYEIVVHGEVNVLRREKFLQGKGQRNDALDFHYIIQMNDQLFTFQEFRKHIFPELMENAGSELNNFIRTKRLNINKPSSALKIIRFYNQHSALLAKT